MNIDLHFLATILVFALLVVSIVFTFSESARSSAGRVLYNLTGLGVNSNALHGDVSGVLTKALDIVDSELSEEQKEKIRARRQLALNREKCEMRAKPLEDALFQITCLTGSPFALRPSSVADCWTMNFGSPSAYACHRFEVRPDSDLFYIVELKDDGTTIEHSGNLAVTVARFMQIAEAGGFISLDALRRLRRG